MRKKIAKTKRLRTRETTYSSGNNTKFFNRGVLHVETPLPREEGKRKKMRVK